MLLILGIAQSAWAGPSDIETKLTASDAGTADSFGFSMGVSGGTAIIGAIGGSGAAYVFDVTTADELVKLSASDAAVDDQFGFSVGISGGTVIVGARGNDDAGGQSGSAYLFDVDPLSPTFGGELFKLTASDAARSDLFADSVGISGNMAIVGAPFEDSGGFFSGAAYLFDVTTGQQLRKLTASNPMPALFGNAVAISGGTAIVGASLENDGPINGSGAAYLFDVDPLSPTFGKELFRLTASDAAARDFLGDSVGISGNRAIVGAWHDEDAGSESGSAYLFDVDPLSPTFGEQLFKLIAPDAAAGDNFGWSVAISDGTAIVGAYRNDDAGSDSGSAYLFDVATGKHLGKLTASDAAWGDFFGFGIAISGDTAIVGAHGNDDGGSRSGSAYLFTIPEPSTLTLAVLALIGLFTHGRRRRQPAQE